ncbi:spherulation-specific family 4 protein [Kibdelosporangium persicum]|uniref:Endoglucanase D n=1 Tax=Kibdelosporangium persicum TaxID=2698649 RepID=A0ABX2FCK3_9PSEU|nr:spherulation-specific family 4 protein [Kibdelosporangium persicum]NRN69087.1 Endoglucanase D [Kibdelosporangium persicum]
MARKLALTCVLIAIALFLPVPAGATADRQQTAVPAYWGPDTPEGMAIFHRLAQNRPTNGIVVLNGSRSMPELPFHPAWAAAIGRLAATGTTTLVYVDTGYHGIDFGQGGHRTREGGTSIPEWSAQIRRDIDDWYAAYGAHGISGVFLDQTILNCGKDDDYARLYAGIRDHIRARHPEAYVVINPGAPAERCYEDVADTIVSFEGDFATYQTHTSPDWQRDHPNPRKFWHLIHNVPTADDMRTVIARSKVNNAGFVYTTELRMDPYPWSGLTSYWDDQLVAASGIADVTPPQAPVGLTATTRANPSGAKVRLTWPTPSDDVAVAGYEVFVNGAKIADTYDNAYQATGLPHTTQHEFAVKARDAAGNLSAASAPLVITTPSGGPPLTDASVCLSPTAADYRVSFGATFSHHRVFIDSDDNPATGWHLPPGLPAGVDLMIENAFLYRHTGPGWAWERVPDVRPLVAEKAGSFHWRVPAAGQSRQVVVFSGFTAEDPPEEYSAAITVEQVPVC